MVPEENPALAGLLAIIRHISLVYGRFMNRPYGRGVLLFLRKFLITPPLRFADGQQAVYGERISRRCLPCTRTVQGLRRNLPFLPGPGQAFIKNLIN